MLTTIINFFIRKPTYKSGPPPKPQLLVTEACLKSMCSCLEPEIQRRHEGVAYLLGLTNGTLTLAASAVRPNAITSPGSFSVSAAAMAAVVRKSTNLGLQVVAQVHTHPGKAYHSDGDVEGARIVYPGFVSIVVPDYGKKLPNLTNSAVYMFRHESGFEPVLSDRVGIVPGRSQ